MTNNDDALLDVVLMSNGGPLGAKSYSRHFCYFFLFLKLSIIIMSHEMTSNDFHQDVWS